MKNSASVNHENLVSTKSKQWPQYMTVLTASISAIASGLHFAWPSPTVPILQSPNYPINITSDDVSNMAMMLPIGDVVGAALAMAISTVIGRRTGILLLSAPFFVGWIIIAFAKSVIIFCIGRFIAGLGDGMLFIFYPMYAGEVTEPKVRGVLGCTLSVGILIGMLLINAFAPYLQITTTALICSSTSVLLVLTFFWMPESPYYLLMKNRKEEARKSLEFLRRCDVTEDLEILEKDVNRQMSETGTFKELITIKSNRKAILIMCGIRAMQQVSGISVWGMFTQTIFISSNSNISPILSSIIYLIVQIIVTTIGSFLVDKYGRKPLILVSNFLCSVTLLFGAVYFYLEENTDFVLTDLNWFPLAVMSTLIVVYSFGLGTAPTLMLGELFSASIKSKALCFMCIYYAVIISLIVKLFNFLKDFGMYVPFTLFGTCCFVNMFIGFWFVPETKGKSLEDIQQELKGNTTITQ